MALYAIHAYENIYHGLHGIEDYDIFSFDSKGEAEDCAYEMSIEVIEKYDCVMQELEDEVYFNLPDDDEENNDEIIFDEVLTNLMYEDVAYEVYEIKNPEGQKLPIDELKDLFLNDPENFIDKYC